MSDDLAPFRRDVERRSTVELAVTGDARILPSSFLTEQGSPKGTRDRRDPSDDRPLSREVPPPGRW